MSQRRSVRNLAAGSRGLPHTGSGGGFCLLMLASGLAGWQILGHLPGQPAAPGGPRSTTVAAALLTGEWPAPAPANDVLPSVTTRFAADTTEIPDFQRHVSPLLGRLGCNGRACHGSFQGQGDFRLSLFGFDFETDHAALLAAGTYRVDIDDPGESLILLKPVDGEDHGGGIRFAENGWEYRLIRNWINGGAVSVDREQQLTRLQVVPAEILTRDEAPVSLQVIAHWNDGSREDVTALSRFRSNDPAIAQVSESGLVASPAEGDTHVVVFYDNQIVPVPVWHPRAGADRQDPVRFEGETAIDRLVLDKLNRLGIRPSPPCDDATFLRRVSLDISGTLPAPDEIRDFLQNPSPDKRSGKIEELLESPGYAAWWTTFFCDLTGNNARQLRGTPDSNRASRQWYNWIYQRVRHNVPWDEMIEGIVLATSRQTGESLTDYCTRMSDSMRDPDNEAAALESSLPWYWMRREFQTGDARAISFAHAFLGVRLQCAQCHKHPFDQWTQEDFRQFARFFSGLRIKPATRPLPGEDDELASLFEQIGVDPEKLRGGNLNRKLGERFRDGGTVPFPELVIGPATRSRAELEELRRQNPPRTREERRQFNRYRTITDAILLGDDSIDLSGYADSREPVMRWLRSPDNRWFARSIANRIWAHYFGTGIVEPADDFNLANPPSNGPLLDYLAEGLVAHDYDLKWLHREITNSHIYQLDWRTNETNRTDRRNFSHALPRRLPAEMVYDSVLQATTGTAANRQFRQRTANRALLIPSTPPDSRRQAVSPSFALNIFGRSRRTSSCDCERSGETSLIQTVYLQNDRDVHNRLAAEDGWIAEMDARLRGPGLTEKQKQERRQLGNRLQTLNRKLKKQDERGDREAAGKTRQQIRQTRQRIEALDSRPPVTERAAPDRQWLVEEAWLRTLGRYPSAEEAEASREYLESDRDLKSGLTGLMWSLINTREFIVNH